MFTDAMIVAAKEAGKKITDYYGKNLESQNKSTAADFRTRADLDSEEIIIKILTEEYPAFNIIAEESGKHHKGSDYSFVIDPLDGTNNFSLTIPFFAVSIGLFYQNESIAGVIHNPISGEVYHAEKDKGAFLNGEQIRVNNESKITQSTLAHSMGYETKSPESHEIEKTFYDKNIKRVNSFWCPSLQYCLLAAGKIEMIIANDNEVYDNAAGMVIMREAGAKITDFSGYKSTNDNNVRFIATNGTALHQETLKLWQTLYEAQSRCREGA